MEKTTPVLFTRKEECCGCGACFAICPRKAIKMVEDDEGFEYPAIDSALCICCHLCVKTCPIKNEQKTKPVQ